MNTCTVAEFFELSKQYPIIDVRAPKEFAYGHIPDAYNVPLFSDDQRAVVGTIYKERGKNDAVRIGLEFVGPQLGMYLDTIASICAQHRVKSSKTIIVYCARGGMRSKSFCMFLACSGYTVYQLLGGFKAFKNYLYVHTNKPYKCIVLGGTTGSGKTTLLKILARQGEQSIDLEELACHKGSVFGALGKPNQPTQEQFIINCLSLLITYDRTKIVWLEKESYKIGNLSIPTNIWSLLQKAPILYITIPREECIQNIIADYGLHAPENLKKCMVMLSKKLGGALTQELCNELDVGNIRFVAEKLFDYYNAQYAYGLQKNDAHVITHISFTYESCDERAQKLLEVASYVL